MSGHMEFDFQFSRPQPHSASRDAADAPLRILILGDFSGRENRGLVESGSALAQRRTVAVDADNFADRLRRMAPRLCLQWGNSAATTTIGFTQLDDFHPDRLYQELEVFGALRQMRRRLLDPAQFAEAAAELRRAGAAAPRGVDSPTAPPAPDRVPPNAAVALEEVLGATPADAAPSQAAVPNEVARLIQSIVAPYSRPKSDPQQAEYVASVDEAIAAEMRNILHHPAFQALEAAWRGVDRLVSRLEIGAQLKLELLDLSRAELAADLASADGPQASGLYKLLVERRQIQGEQPYSLLVGLYTFDAGAADVRLLGALGAIAAQADAPLLAAAAPQVLGVNQLCGAPDPDDWPGLDADSQQRWQALRRAPGASWLGLALPRVLLRLPYGKRFSATERFEFEELSAVADHESFLWGNPAIHCALLLGESFLRGGWSMNPRDHLESDDLPAYYYHEDGEAQLLPCGEALLTVRAAEAILDRGVMPWLSFRDRGAIRLARFQSLADPPAPLSGRWR